jgi:integrase
MGSVRARADNGCLFFDFRFQGVRCREQTLLTDTPANRKRMEKVLAQIEGQIASGEFNYAQSFPSSRLAPRFSSTGDALDGESARSAPAAPPAAATLGLAPPPSAVAAAVSATPTFAEFAEQWVNEHQVEWRRSHIRVLQSTLQGHLLPRFGARPVGSISKADVLAYRNALCQLPGRNHATLSPKRVNGILALMRQILGEAAERHGFANPMLNLKTLCLKKSDVEPFTLDEVQRVLSTVRADYRDYFVVRFFTGMRTGECHGLKWKYVDFDSRIIRIRETFVLGEDEYTKTDSSQRDIQMSQPVFEALQRQHQATARLSAYVFCNREGKPLDNKNFTDRVWYPLLRHLGVSERRPYQMRHTAATLWLASGEAPEWIARQLGHASTEMLFRVYSRYVPNLTRRDGSAIDRLLASRFAGGLASSQPAPAQTSPGGAHV